MPVGREVGAAEIGRVGRHEYPVPDLDVPDPHRIERRRITRTDSSTIFWFRHGVNSFWSFVETLPERFPGRSKQ